MVITLLGLGLVAAFCTWCQQRANFLQYVFLSRYPLLAMALLLGLPFLVLSELQDFASNMFVMEPTGVAVVAFLATLTAWASAFSLGLLYITIPVRCQIRFLKAPPRPDVPPGAAKDELDVHRTDDPDQAREKRQKTNPIPDWVHRYGFSLAALLGVPAGSVAAWHCSRGILAGSLGMIAGLAAAKLFQLLWTEVLAMAARASVGKGRGLLPSSPFLRRIYRTFFFGYKQNERRFQQINGWTFLLLLAGVYVVLFFLAHPRNPMETSRTLPALGFVLLLIAISCLLLSGLSMFFDVWRAPVPVILIVVSYLGYGIRGSDHEYPVLPAPADASSPFRPEDAAEAWIRRRADESRRIPVFVTASGGGIKAALWTATVLGGLRQDPDIGDRFARSLFMVSSVSGGSVGSMYFVDGYSEHDPPTVDQARRAIESAGTSSLTAVAWGLSYPDLGRVVFSAIIPSRIDRGWAIEERWKRNLQGDPTMAGWARGVREGWRPVSIFNSTVVETGDRFTFSPVDVPLKKEEINQADQRSLARRAQSGGIVPRLDFRALYPGKDLRVSTAVRMSATFPWVSPVARPDDAVPRYHLADGGYYDNEGIVSAIEFMDAVLEPLHCEKAILIRILASPPADTAPAADDRGWIYSAIGPLFTMIHVRSTSQAVRNQDAVNYLVEFWSSQDIEIRVATFVLGVDASMSWNLSDKERDDIAGAWARAATTSGTSGFDQANAKSLADVRRWLKPSGKK
jgi:hypothetical protein